MAVIVTYVVISVLILLVQWFYLVSSLVVINSIFRFLLVQCFDCFLNFDVECLITAKLVLIFVGGFVTFGVYNCSSHVEIQTLYAKGISWTRRPLCRCGKS